MYLASYSWKKASELTAKHGEGIVALLPIGNLEEHGPIGPLGTDYIIPESMASTIEARLPDKVLVLPTMPYGVSPALKAFPGTVDIGEEALTGVLKGIVDAVLSCGVRRVLFFNGHGGNWPALSTAALYLYQRGGQAAQIDWWVTCAEMKAEWKCGHGGGIEASAAMAVRPDWVHPEDCFASEVVHFSDTLRNVHIHNVLFEGATVKMIRNAKDSIPSGDAGYDDSPSRASRETGQAIVDAVVDYTVRFIGEFSKIDLSIGRREA